MRLISFLFVLLLTSPVSARWKCTGEDRCHDFQQCNWDGQLTWCSKASSSAISFGLKFSDGLNFSGGHDVFVEWAYEDEHGNLVELHDHGYALVDGIKTKFWNTDPDCVEFEATDQNPSFGYGECSSVSLSWILDRQNMPWTNSPRTHETFSNVVNKILSKRTSS